MPRRLDHLSDDQLLGLRLRDLGVSWRRSWIAGVVRQVRRELAARELRLDPHVWVSDEWFSPDGVPGVAIPFYLLHPRLVRLERKQVLQVEGGTRESALRILRHEAGHAMQHAFGLHRLKRWRELFGSGAQPYPDFYQPNPASRRYVIHLPYWYAQAHPAEDFAETFAVWLAPGQRWRKRYAGWQALAKLEYVDELMRDLAGARAPVRSVAKIDPIERNEQTLADYYAQKRGRFRIASTEIYDEDLLRVFAEPGRRPRGESAAGYLGRHKTRLRRRVARHTGKHELALDVVLGDMIARARELGLRTHGSPRALLVELAILLAARSVEYVYRAREWHAL
ncbi:MAG TPA: putative zinc-binding metallopeptidase [Myxococcota bacterium]|nr:putative zinc-binding metallopeptidase [Myxococcota bacterium]